MTDAERMGALETYAAEYRKLEEKGLIMTLDAAAESGRLREALRDVLWVFDQEKQTFNDNDMSIMSDDRGRIIRAARALLATPPVPSDHGACTNCHHTYAEHTGRTLRPYGMPRLPSGLGPPELRPGWCCEHLDDPLHAEETT